MINSPTTGNLRTWWPATLVFWRRHWLEITILVLSTVAILFGYAGFAKIPPAADQAQSRLDILYLTIQLFVLQSGVVPGPVPWELEVARFLAPLAIAGVILKLFYETVQELLLRITRKHVVVCGLGRKGLQLVKDFHRDGNAVVTIEKDEENDAIRICRALGALVLVGDATDKALLKKARVDRARHVVVVCHDDGVNLEIALHTLQLVKEKKVNPKKKIICHVHVIDLQLHESLRQQSLFADFDDPLDVIVFNTYANCARRMLRDHPLDYRRITTDDSRVVHLVILGFDRMGQSVALQAAKIGHYAHGKKLRITVIDSQVERQKREFLSRYPKFGMVCDTQYLDMDTEDLDILEKIREAAHDQHNLTTIVVCLDNDSHNMTWAMRIDSRIGHGNVPILVHMAEEGGLVDLIKDKHRIKPFGMANITCTRELLLHEDLDKLAKVAHEDYREKQKAHTPDTDPAMQRWELLAPDFQDSNRQQADHIPAKLRAIGCFSDYPVKGKQPVAEFSNDEVEILARMEHSRWNADRILAGWTFGVGPRDIQNRTSPYLVSWEELPDHIRERDRQAVRNVFRLLDAVGEKVYRSA
jgi:hypothetical protein